MEYKLSICIPTLNRGSYIGETLESIVSQLENGVEIVIVDGGSTDNTEVVVKSYQDTYPDIRYVKKDSSGKKPSNEGFDRDCNHAVELAYGDYCWLMTDDDLLNHGAIKKVLYETEKNYALIVASVEVRNSDFTELLVNRRPNLALDRIFTSEEFDEFAITVGSHLTFVGAVIIKRSLWLNKCKEKYFGSGFVHVGVIFDEPITEEMLVISNPLVSIRFGNAQWTSRAFQIWMINWPSLVWSFSSISDAAKLAICPRAPYKSLTTLLFNRALGMYSTREYKLFIDEHLNTMTYKLFSKLIARLPRALLYIPVWLYIRIFLPESTYVLFNLRESWKKNNCFFNIMDWLLMVECAASSPLLCDECTNEVEYLMYQKIDKCRICGNPHLELVLDLGEQMLTGVFPREKGKKVTIGPLRLVKCVGGEATCGLLQMEHSYNLGEMYGENYGYRSGLNASMVAHLNNKVKRILGLVELHQGDLVIDIGSNDSTTLQAYPASGPVLVGVDPTGVKFHNYYPPHIQLIPDFFSSALVKAHFPKQKAKVVTSFSMFYDLEDPMGFMRQVHDVLADDGVWVFEQSYMPTMLATNSYDTVCHEHLEFYALRQIKWMTDRVGFKILDVEFNDINGGSFSVTVSKSHEDLAVAPSVQKILDDEHAKGLDTLVPYLDFAERVVQTKRDLRKFLETAHAAGKSVAVLGASTKGNVLLQYCGLTTRDVEVVGEVNPEKFGCYTPGTWIPIIPEQELLAKKPDYVIVLPWHFRRFFTSNEKLSGMNLVFPLPNVEVVSLN